MDSIMSGDFFSSLLSSMARADFINWTKLNIFSIPESAMRLFQLFFLVVLKLIQEPLLLIPQINNFPGIVLYRKIIDLNTHKKRILFPNNNSSI